MKQRSTFMVTKQWAARLSNQTNALCGRHIIVHFMCISVELGKANSEYTRSFRRCWQYGRPLVVFKLQLVVYAVPCSARCHIALPNLPLPVYSTVAWWDGLCSCFTPTPNLPSSNSLSCWRHFSCRRPQRPWL
ncbi:hypothetical protein RvY_18971-1 [Ramazzottius varieornatus]|uniref:Uncharacterized protein n=1 Tax=Ramazzottius varieornatus TaxID=947166 RepID=A0A1D1W7Q9_RAMVA|nr:hypothetical protein RvY_18971-1 [Ramazzottius varieornatus]